jgi:hypothetical protein
MVNEYIKEIKGIRKDAKFELVLAFIPIGIGYWSFEWAVIAGIFMTTLALIEILRILRLIVIFKNTDEGGGK